MGIAQPRFQVGQISHESMKPLLLDTDPSTVLSTFKSSSFLLTLKKSEEKDIFPKPMWHSQDISRHGFMEAIPFCYAIWVVLTFILLRPWGWSPPLLLGCMVLHLLWQALVAWLWHSLLVVLTHFLKLRIAQFVLISVGLCIAMLCTSISRIWRCFSSKSRLLTVWLCVWNLTSFNMDLI